MKSRILTMSLVVALAAALIGGATMSLFTADAQTADRTYAAGTLEVGVGDQVIEIGAIDCMAPGDTLRGEFTVENTGSLKLWFDVTPITKRIEDSDNNYLFSGDNGAQVLVVDQDTEEPWVLEAGEDKDISFEVHLPLDAGNWYQEAEGDLYFKIHAEQCLPELEFPFTAKFKPGMMFGKLTLHFDNPVHDCNIELKISKPGLNWSYDPFTVTGDTFEIPLVPNCITDSGCTVVLTIGNKQYENFTIITI